MEKNTFFVFFSNKLEALAQLAQQRLFSDRLALARRLIIVPDAQVKTFLYRYFALGSPTKVAFGLEILTLAEALHALTRQAKQENPFYIPTRLDFSITIEGILADLYVSDQTDFSYSLLYQYLGEKKSVIGSTVRGKMISLAEELAHFFSIMGMQNSSVIEEWLSINGWEQKIWKRIFHKNPFWAYPEKIVREVAPSIDRVCLFGFSYLPGIYLQFFKKITVYAYLLSPSEFFWEDVYSDKERVFLQKVLEGKKTRLKVREQLDFYLRESNPLIGNWGKLGREFIRQIGLLEPYIEELYVSDQGDTTLKRLQNDFLHLGQDQYELEVLEDDGSLELYSCTSNIREVEVLLEKLQNLMTEDHSIEPKDIIVLSPDIERYIPYIHQVFSQSCLPYKITDTRSGAKEDLLLAIEHLVDLTDQRFDLFAVLDFFSFAPFFKKQGWTQEQLGALRRWADKVCIQWGINKENRKAILEKTVGQVEEVSDQGTWMYGLERLLSGLVFSRDDTEGVDGFAFPWPSYLVDWNESEFLGQVIKIIDNLYEDMRKAEHMQASFADWLRYFEEMLPKYFVFTNDNVFLEECKKIQRASDIGGLFSLGSFKRIIASLSHLKKTSYQPALLQAITFSSLKPGSALPYKVIYLIGMDEESFPRKESRGFVADMGVISKRGYFPSQKDEDQYLFLEVLLSCRQHLLISYCRISSQDHKLQTAAAPVEELIAYLEDKYPKREGKKRVVIHPALSFDRSYFCEGSIFRPSSLYLQKLALTYYSAKKTPLPPFFPVFYGIEPSCNPSSIETIRLDDLLKFAKNPIKFFFQDQLGIYFPSLFQKEDPEFILAGYQKAHLRKDSMEQDWVDVIDVARAKGHLPLGPFGDIAIKKIEQEQQMRAKQWSHWGIDPGQIHSICLNRSVKGSQFTKNTITIPALEITSPQGIKFLIEGTLNDVTSTGICFHIDNTLQDLISIWPLYLVYLNVAPILGRKETSLYPLKTLEKMEFMIEKPEQLLGHYLDYFQSCKTQPSFLMPAWSSKIFKEDEKDFIHMMQQRSFIDISPFPDDYLRWLFLRDPSPSAQGFYHLKTKIDPTLFNPLLE